METSLVPLEGLDDSSAQSEAIRKIEAHFSNIDSLASVTNHKISLIQQKKTIEAQIKNEVHSELEKSKKGLETLYKSYNRINKMDESFTDTEVLCSETANLIGYYSLIKKVNTVRVNLTNILKEVDRLLTIPEKAAEIEQLLSDDLNLLLIHKKIRELERLHQKALKQFESNFEELEAIKDMFSSVPELSLRFENKIWDLVGKSVSVAQEKPAVLVKVAQIIEREKIYEQQQREKKKSNISLVSSEGIDSNGAGGEDYDRNRSSYGDRFFEVLSLSISSRFEPMFLNSHTDLVSTLRDVNKMVEELFVVMDTVQECYPPSYDLFNYYVDQYHTKFYSLFGSFSKIVESNVTNREHLARQIPSAHILMLVEWVVKNYSRDLSRLGIQDISPPLLDALDPLIKIYKFHIKSLMRDWCDNIINNDNQNKPDVVDGQYCSLAPIQLFESVASQLDIANATKCQKLVVGVIEEVVSALLYFQVSSITLLQERNHEIKLENLIAYVNNNSKCYDHTQTIVDKVSNILDSEHMALIDFDPVLEGFLNVSKVATQAISSVIFRDLDECISKFFTQDWYQEDLMQPIINTFEDYFVNDIQKFILENYLKRLSLLCLDILIERVLTQLICGRNKFNDQFYKIMSNDCDKLLDFFKKYLRLSVVTAKVQILEDFKQMITSDIEMTPIYFRSIINFHKDINEKIVEAVLSQRTDVNKTQINQQIEQTKAVIANVLPEGSEPQGIFSRMNLRGNSWW
ncbi:hypothetical protein DICPUDRAFT_155933 [Dictyostelium purpureum]|uniref:Uncharacterized protein n=1 Tax=Dictyostelium purpureum TaxID=5786 RepID=F0ZV95_DICPU|nr:uncharacterized protein DICPUDRAFT_155933 [Dictyostelium purpureum]EGC32138.1 hypothetical protein DICPUDRAFT_155933 [Dictyostelium purpureum]|eukprot:XP_003291347.1 hypothetical protein DICPUDRAFT_155933 [Dictyostelium purpureum]